MYIAIGSDHAGFELTGVFANFLRELGYELVGCRDPQHRSSRLSRFRPSRRRNQPANLDASNATVRAKSYCDFFVLEKSEFTRVAQDNPKFLKSMMETAQARYNISTEEMQSEEM
jgi:hypothetical protein